VANAFGGKLRLLASAFSFDLTGCAIPFTRQRPFVLLAQLAKRLCRSPLQLLAELACQLPRRLLGLGADSIDLGGQTPFGGRGCLGQLRLQTPLPFGPLGLEPGDELVLRLRSGLAPRLVPCSFDLFPLAGFQSGELSLEVGLEARTNCAYGVTKLVVGHFWHYRERPQASQASGNGANPNPTTV
jgi:hypothetical protein